jgi:hypothetical protein
MKEESKITDLLDHYFRDLNKLEQHFGDLQRSVAQLKSGARENERRDLVEAEIRRQESYISKMNDDRKRRLDKIENLRLQYERLPCVEYKWNDFSHDSRVVCDFSMTGYVRCILSRVDNKVIINC